jgi:hypothetical protein
LARADSRVDHGYVSSQIVPVMLIFRYSWRCPAIVIVMRGGRMSVRPMALYYPWMHFQDDSWVKLSLLTWEKLVRVRPSDLEDRDNDFVRRIRAETDLLVETVPSARDLATVSVAFGNVLDDYRLQVTQGHGIERYDDSEAEIFRAPITQNYLGSIEDLLWQSPFSGRYPRDDELTWIYCGSGGSRMDVDLQGRLVKRVLAKRAPDEGPWIGMRPKLASIYMATLADAVATHNDLVPTTDDSRMHSAFGAIDRLADLLLEKPSEQVREEPTGAYIHLAVKSVIEPKNLDAVPIDRLISFRARHKAELGAFWNHVSGLADELARVSTVENPELARLHMQDIYDRQTKPLLRELQSGLRAYGVESVAGAMALKVDLAAASGTALGTAALAGGHIALGGASLALTFVPYVIHRRHGSKGRRESSPVAYLLAANRKLAGRSLLRSLR